MMTITVTTSNRLLSIKELEAMGFGSRSKIDRMVKQGLLKRIKIGFSTRFYESDIKAFLAKGKQSN
ncbi:helix-turn-helix transcriptional regulator [Actinobacillus delphinicola]|nr:helix-turn-helix domain-containing protein [Actinobacillus delphinicola]